MMKIADLRDEVRQAIVADLRRRGEHRLCEGYGFKPHICSSSYDLNEVIYPRNRFQKLPLEKRLYFFHVYNCAINCHTFHMQHGHSRKYRDWHERMVKRIYGEDQIDEWIANSPLRYKER